MIKKVRGVAKLSIPSILVMCVCSLSACTVFSGRESTGEYIDDAAVTTAVKHAILSDRSLKPFQIGVETYKGEVQLSGFVTTEVESLKAEQDARGTNGVKGVKNNLIVRANSPRR